MGTVIFWHIWDIPRKFQRSSLVFKLWHFEVQIIFITWPNSTTTEYGPILVQTLWKYILIFGLHLLVSYNLRSVSEHPTYPYCTEH